MQFIFLLHILKINKLQILLLIKLSKKQKQMIKKNTMKGLSTKKEREIKPINREAK